MTKQKKLDAIYKTIQETNYGNESEGDKFVGLLIGDVLNRIDENNIEQKEFNKLRKKKGEGTQFTYTPTITLLLHYWKDKTKILDSQDNNCIDFIYLLIEDETNK